MRVLLLGLTSLTLVLTACGGPLGPFGCGPVPQCETPTIVGEGARCGDVSCQICKKGLTCAYDADSEAQICESNEDGPVTGDPDLSQVPDLAGEKPDLGPPDADLPDADRPDAGEADLRGVGLE